jgi:uncharacterized protein YrzB (UPF0473 family)
MNNEAQTQQEEAIITLEGEDGHSYSCQILDIFDFEGHEYALLLKMGEPKPEGTPEEDEEGSLVIMRLIQREDQSIFQTIESDDEFEKVVAHVEELARQAEKEGAEE